MRNPLVRLVFKGLGLDSELVQSLLVKSPSDFLIHPRVISDSSYSPF